MDIRVGRGNEEETGSHEARDQLFGAEEIHPNDKLADHGENVGFGLHKVYSAMGNIRERPREELARTKPPCQTWT